MTKEPNQVKCDYCGKWFATTRAARFCSDSCRVKWHQNKKRQQEVLVYRTLRRALEYCVEQHPGLRVRVNEILREASEGLPDLQAHQGHDADASS